jgi:hypothetical protein
MSAEPITVCLHSRTVVCQNGHRYRGKWIFKPKWCILFSKLALLIVVYPEKDMREPIYKMVQRRWSNSLLDWNDSKSYIATFGDWEVWRCGARDDRFRLGHWRMRSLEELQLSWTFVTPWGYNGEHIFFSFTLELWYVLHLIGRINNTV